MALVISDRTRETSTSTGLGNFVLAGAQAGFQTFAAHMTVGDTTWYVITGPGGSWETGVGTLVGATTLERTTPLESSNGDAKVNFAAGTKDVFVTVPGKRVLDPSRVEPLRDPVTKAQAEAGTGEVPKAWSELRVREAAIAIDTEVLLASWDAAALNGLAQILYDLPAGFAFYVIKFGNLRIGSGGTVMTLRNGPAGGTPNQAANTYQVTILQQRGTVTDAQTATGNAANVISLDPNGSNGGEITILDGTNNFWTTRMLLHQLDADGVMVCSTRTARYTPGGGRWPRVQLGFNAPLTASGFVRIYGVK